MPSTQKTLHFMSSALVTAISVGLLGYGMSAVWAKMSMDCINGSNNGTDGTAEISLGLVSGYLERDFCPTFQPNTDFEVIPSLVETPEILHILVLFLLALCLLFSALSILISLYNSVSNPYETYMGPIGIYVCSSLSACLSVLALIIFAVNVSVTNVGEHLVQLLAKDIKVDLRNKSSEMQVGFFLVIPYTVLCLSAIALIYMYDHAAYTHRREQQRPTEDAPKEIMMY